MQWKLVHVLGNRFALHLDIHAEVSLYFECGTIFLIPAYFTTLNTTRKWEKRNLSALLSLTSQSWGPGGRGVPSGRTRNVWLCGVRVGKPASCEMWQCGSWHNYNWVLQDKLRDSLIHCHLIMRCHVALNAGRRYRMPLAAVCSVSPGWGPSELQPLNHMSH